MKRSDLRRTSPLRRAERPLERRTSLKRGAGLKRTAKPAVAVQKRSRKPISPATPAQRRKAKAQGCIVCGPGRGCGTVHPAHVIDRSLLSEGQDDPRAVVGLGSRHHREYDDGLLDLLPHLERRGRVELGFAVERFGLLATLRRVTNQRWTAG